MTTAGVSQACVVHVVPANGGGVDRHVRDICSLRPQDVILHVADAQIVLETPQDHRFIPIDRSDATFSTIASRVGRPLAIHAHSTLQAARESTSSLCKAWQCDYVLTLHDIEFCTSDNDAELQARSRFVEHARAVIVPSRYIDDLLNSQPAPIGRRAEIIANGVDCAASGAVATIAPHLAGRCAVAVVGALGEHKGLSFLKAVVEHLPSSITVVLVGYADGQLGPGEVVAGRIWAHGAFESVDLRSLLDAYGCRIVFFPNRQPESFSYTLSDVWCADRPVLVPDAGALAERVDQCGGGWTYPLDADAATVARLLQSYLAAADAGQVPPRSDQQFSVREMVDAIERVYAARGATADRQRPDWAQLNATAAAQLDGTFFRAELRRLSFDLAFAQQQIAAQLQELRRLEQEYEGRGRWIAKLEGDHESLSRELAVLVAEQARYQNALEASNRAHQRDVDKLTRDVNDTLAVAHHYERALAQIPGPLRRWLLRRGDKTRTTGDGGVRDGD